MTDGATMTTDDYTELFAEMSREELEVAALNLALDCDRLRRELDDATGIIR